MRHFLLLMFGFSLVSISVTGCGGGGGGGGSTPDTGFSYTGLSTPAMINDSNADILVGTGLYGTVADSITLNASIDEGAQGEASLNLVGLTKTLANVARSIDSTNLAAHSASNAMQNADERIDGSCGGSAAYDLIYNEATGEFNGSMTFTSYDECYGETINGTVTISGALDPNSLELEVFTMNFNHLTATSELGSEVLSGTVRIETTGAFSYEVSCSMLYQINSSATCKLEDLVMIFDESSYPTTVTLTGRAYHPAHGYVDLSTPTPLQFSYDSAYPYTGVIELRGANGAGGGPTTATATFLGSNLYSIEVDSNGNGTADTVMSCSWNPDVCI